MPICCNCKAEYLKGKKICSHCGEELYRGLLTDSSDDEDIFDPIDWIKITNVTSEYDAEIILKQLSYNNIPAMRKNNGVPFEEIGVFQPENIDIYVPQWMENKANEIID